MPANVEQPRPDDKSATPCEHGYMASCKLLAVHTFRNDALPWVHREKQRLYLMIFSPLISVRREKPRVSSGRDKANPPGN